MIEIKNKKYYTRDELATALDVGPETISRWRREGKLKGCAVNRRKYVFCETEIESLIKGEKGDKD